MYQRRHDPGFIPELSANIRQLIAVKSITKQCDHMNLFLCTISDGNGIRPDFHRQKPDTGLIEFDDSGIKENTEAGYDHCRLNVQNLIFNDQSCDF